MQQPRIVVDKDIYNVIESYVGAWQEWYRFELSEITQDVAFEDLSDEAKRIVTLYNARINSLTSFLGNVIYEPLPFTE